MPKILFLPGAGGSPTFWKAVADRLPKQWPANLLGWPGLGVEAHDPNINSLSDLTTLVELQITEPVDLVAQSMGGVVAARLAIARPDLVRRLVLTVTSAGVDMGRFGARDWRPEYRSAFPNAADWITQQDAAAPLAVEEITAPTLLLWGDSDEISPVAVGEELARRIPKAELHVLPEGDHELAIHQADVVAELIQAHLV